jgi:hypothetical protein
MKRTRTVLLTVTDTISTACAYHERLLDTRFTHVMF